ncbi:MAG: putative toxin-antitoxin system toxin component, PIN family [Clostridia bacterium]|nr:putative toxin-antitoxin system toxin component, PIN family [Clostridia bacterium]
MKYYAVLDTNVVVSAMLKWQSVPGEILISTFNGVIVPVLNDEILAEYRTVLSRPKFGLTSEIVESVLAGITENAVFLDAETLDVELPDPKDRVFYEVVMEKRKDEDAYLVTGNIRHFPTKPFIVTPREMMDIILEQTKETE